MRRATLLVFAVLALAGCGGDETATPQAAPADEIEDLDNVLALRSDFEAERAEADAGKPRVLFLLSPT